MCLLDVLLCLLFPSSDMTNIVLLLVIIMLVFSVIGITLFRDVVPRYFGTLSSGILCSKLNSYNLPSLVTITVWWIVILLWRTISETSCSVTSHNTNSLWLSTFMIFWIVLIKLTELVWILLLICAIVPHTWPLKCFCFSGLVVLNTVFSSGCSDMCDLYISWKN